MYIRVRTVNGRSGACVRSSIGRILIVTCYHATRPICGRDISGGTHMKTIFRSLLIWLSLIGVALTSAAQQPRFGAPKDYVLVLGDSLAFGYQRPKFQMTQDPANFTTGFADS